MLERWALGLDLGQVTDYSALSLIRERADDPEAGPTHDVPYLHRWPLGTSYPAIIKAAVARTRDVAAREPGALVYLVVDGTGVGRPVVDALAEAMRGVAAALIAVVITSGTAARFDLRDDGAQEWHIPKKDLVGAVQVLLQGARLNVSPRLAEARTLTAELKNFRMKFTQAANAQYEAWRDGDHDDLVLAVALPCWALLHGPLGGPATYAVGGERLPAGFDARIEGGHRQPDPRKGEVR
jgi:hypothetical protein